ncbi:hypothetical protein SAMN05216227_100634 [Pseudorhodobacter antarcticus]|uniref:Uncharacterized protein n=1 Tax=Pseudorhodobacter antarcticus TaxID=1077947 RepID=A0A1H8D177_9RHOB|nr:hypothetical protein [Pseudorhodobacter antarcticus]SEN01053.1 hypothetical protein SAMN05216227_100634 [Pseudorhodobacter antarcticus]
MTTDPSHSTGSVARRRVFYIPGYDPFHPRRYRELYRKEGAEQAAISDYALDLKPKAGGGAYGWQVASQIGGADVAAQVEVLVWSDIVKDSMATGIVVTYVQLVKTAWIYITSGALFRLMRLRKGPVIAALYPLVFLLGQLGLAALVVRLGVAFGMAFLPMGGLLGLGVGAVLAVALLHWFRRVDNKVFAYYLMHDYAYSAQFNGANPPELEERMADFGIAIAAALTHDVEEVLVVGHSSGVHIGVSVLADLIRAGRVPAGGPALSFLSLGQVVPMVSFLPDAHRLRADLAFLSASDALVWVDVTAPGDGCAFALCDPVAVSGVAPVGQRWPLVFSAAFTQTLSPQRWRELRWRFFRLHFQYLCAFDRPRDYDYFQITAGPLTLNARYAGRGASAQRITRAVNKYTSVVP